MIVVDASAAVELLLRTPAGDKVESLVDEHQKPMAPAGMDGEVFVALRRLHLTGQITKERLIGAVLELRDVPVERFPLQSLLEAAVLHLDRFGGHDVFYALLALQHGCPLVTRDAHFARAAASLGVEAIAV
ncbi:MAG: type II toxin-antitoxin system VapC family toxin [Chloroflexota bacterium]